MTSIIDGVALVAAGALAGLVGSAGGITSLISYPALLVVGLPALRASIANNVALVACWPGSALSSRSELRGWLPWLRRWTVVAAAGGAAGAALLLSTPPRLFERIVPGLVAAGSLGLLLEPRLSAWRQRRARSDSRLALPIGLLALSLYNGYFGAGAGVMTLTLTLLLVERRFSVANALKNMLIGAASVVSAIIFASSGSVDWTAAACLALGMFIGSNLGPRIVRRLPVGLLRALIAVLGLGLAVRLALHGGT
ncbi:MAG TPA: sulfite exporter TauE/SafE family protein [Solirubrobacteraceae bacterium]|nr:sulfite exporter TauE/SafE family protein [Solirubrobacteraceae bacterium]